MTPTTSYGLFLRMVGRAGAWTRAEAMEADLLNVAIHLAATAGEHGVSEPPVLVCAPVPGGGWVARLVDRILP